MLYRTMTKLNYTTKWEQIERHKNASTHTQRGCSRPAEIHWTYIKNPVALRRAVRKPIRTSDMALALYET